MIKIYKENNLDKYIKFFNNLSNGNIFLYPDVLKLYVDAFDIWWVNKNNNDICVALILYKNDNLIDRDISFLPYYCPQFSDQIENLQVHKKIKVKLDIVKILLQELKKNYDKISFICDTKTDDVRPYQWFNYEDNQSNRFNIDINYTAIINLKNYQNIENYFKTVRYVRRSDLKKNNLNNCSTLWTKDKKYIDQFIDLRNLTFKRQNQKIPTSENKLINDVINTIIDIGKGELLIIQKQDKPIGSAFIVFHKSNSYYFFAASDPKYRDIGIGTKIVYEAIKKSMEKKIALFDFIGVNSPNRGDFKLSFNANIIPYYGVNWKMKLRDEI